MFLNERLLSIGLLISSELRSALFSEPPVPALSTLLTYASPPLQDEGSGAATPVKIDAPAVTEDLDFSDLKKKKKSSKKKAAFDLEAFEKELGEARKEDGGDDDGENVDGGHLENIDEADLGENVFAGGEVPVGVDSGVEPWLGSDRDYAYPEVGPRRSTIVHVLTSPPRSSSADSTPPCTLPTPRCSPPPGSASPSPRRRSTAKATKSPCSRTSPRSASACTGSRNT